MWWKNFPDYCFWKSEYLHTRNPLYVWKEISRRIKLNKPLSKWTLDYLFQCANDLERIEPRKGYKADVAKAIGFRDARFLTKRTLCEKFAVYDSIEGLRKREGSLAKAIEQYMVERGLDEGYDMLEDIYQEIQRIKKEVDRISLEEK